MDYEKAWKALKVMISTYLNTFRSAEFVDDEFKSALRMVLDIMESHEKVPKEDEKKEEGNGL